MIQLEQVLPAADASKLHSGDGGVARLAARRQAAVAWFEAQSLFVAGAAAVAAFSLAKVPQHLNQDGWLALVGGRYIAAHGIPQHDTLTVMTHGARWIDQQWLAQLAMYELHQAGGLALYTLVYVAMTMAGLGMAIAAAHALGGSERHVLWVLPAAGFLYFAGSFQIRTQGFAYPLFAATLWLLAKEVRAESRGRVYFVLPLLILWGNLHGSVTVGVALATLYGVTLLIEDLGGGAWRPARHRVRRRTVVFLVAPVPCLFVTPYGGAMVSYYRETLLNPAFGHLVTEWQPVTSVLALAIPFFALAFATIWLLGRCGRRARLFDQLTLVVLALGAILAIRNITWFGLAVLMLMPCAIGTLLPSRGAHKRHPALNLPLAGVSLVILAGAVIAVSVKPDSWFERRYDHRALSVVAAEVRQRPRTLIYASDRFGDWLLWQEPSLAGHIAYDIRFELLTNRQLQGIAGLGQLRAPRAHNILGPYSLLVLDSGTRLALDRPGTHVILRGKGVVVATKPKL